MPRTNYFLVDPIQNFRGEQPQVVFECLKFVVLLIRPVTVAEHLANGVVLVGQFLDTVVVGIESQSENAEHEDLPLRHPGATIVGVGLTALLGILPFGKNLFEYGKYRPAYLGRHIDMLKSQQYLWNIITGFWVQTDGADVQLAYL